MSIEATHKFSNLVKRVEFFQFEWSANLLAVCFNDSVQIFKFIESSIRKEDLIEQKENQPQQQQGRLIQILTVPFQQKIERFSWNPKTNISSLKPIISFCVSDCSQNIIFIDSHPTSVNEPNETVQSQNIQTKVEKFEVDCIYALSFDYHNGEYLAFAADNSCFLYDCVDWCIKARFNLETPAAKICWHRDEKTKFMVGERSGVIRIYSLETLKPIYSIMSYNRNLRAFTSPLLSFDWSQMSPETIVANTHSEILIWNTSESSLPEKVMDKIENLRFVKLCQLKDNLIGYVDGTDTCSKLTITNFKTNQIIYQSRDMKLLNSFSFNSLLPLIAISSEQQVIVKKIVG